MNIADEYKALIESTDGLFDNVVTNNEIAVQGEKIQEIFDIVANIKEVKGDKGDKGERGTPGRDGSDGKDGKNGSPDTAEEIISKINTVENGIEWKTIKDAPDYKPDIDKLYKQSKQWGDQRFHGAGVGTTTFTGLTDVPNSYAGQANKVVVVNPTATGLQFVTSAPSQVAYSVVNTAVDYSPTDTAGEVMINVDATAGNKTITLPTAVGNNALFNIKKIDSSANTVSVVGPIDGATQIIRFQWNSMTAGSSGTVWYNY